jgi:hypothetical protein
MAMNACLQPTFAAALMLALTSSNQAEQISTSRYNIRFYEQAIFEEHFENPPPTSDAFHVLFSIELTDPLQPGEINTSFNENEPIVHTPKQAIDCFARTRMNALAVGPFWYDKPLEMAERGTAV